MSGSNVDGSQLRARVTNYSAHKLKRGVSSPTLVWFASLHLSSLMTMIAFNIARVGFNKVGFLGGPEYYTRLFLYYGLNNGAPYDTPWMKGIGPWIIGPYLAVWMGMALFFLREAGFAINGTTFVDPQARIPYAFFSENVFAYEINPFGNPSEACELMISCEEGNFSLKFNLFFIGIVFLPVIIASIMTVMYKNKVERESSLLARFTISSLIGLWLGNVLAKMTDPNLNYNVSGIRQSLFRNRNFNAFVVYKGEYSPLMIALTFTLYHIVTLILLGFIASSGSLYRGMRLSYSRYLERREMQLARKEYEEQELKLGEQGLEDDETTDALLNVNNIYTYFKTESGVVKALDGVSFDVRKNESVGVVGESGCGKTVTSQSILRILPKNGETIHGEVKYKGYDLLKLSNKQMQKIRGKEIALLFQNPLSALNPVLSIRDQMIDVIALHRDVDAREASNIAIAMMTSVGIPDAENRIDDYPHQYSGGMRQRILIARALTLQPKLLIADEPTTALDVTIQAQVLDIIQKMRERFGLSLMLITHNLGVVAENTDRIHIFYGGRVVESGPTKEIFRDPKHPYTIALLASIPSFKDVKGELSTISGTVPQLINPPPGCRFHPRCEFATEVCKTRPTFKSVGKDRFVACFHLDEVHKAQ